MRIGIIMSAVGHVALLLCALINPARLQTAHGDTVAVELVSPAEFAAAAKTEKPQADIPAPLPASPLPRPAETKAAPPSPPPKRETAATPQQPLPQPPQSAPATAQSQPSQQPQPPQPAPTPFPPSVNEMQADPNRLAALLHLPLNSGEEGFGSEAQDKAKLSREEIAAFKAHLKTCWSLPPGIAETQRVKVVVRVSLKPDGALATPPTLIEASASALGPPLVQNAMRALKECAPFRMLPAAKYKEWRVLDLNFSPDAMAGG